MHTANTATTQKSSTVQSRPLEQFIPMWEKAAEMALTSGPLAPLRKPTALHAMADISTTREWIDNWIAAVAHATGTEEEVARRKILAQLAPLLNQQEWRRLESRHSIRNGAVVLNEMIPLNQEFAHRTPGAASFAKFGSTGKSSLSQTFALDTVQAPQALVNGWFTRLGNEFGEELFAAFRSGSMIHHGEKNSVKRALVAKASALELLTAIAAEQFGRLSPDAAQNVLDGKRSLELTIVTLDMQSTQVDEQYGLGIENWIVPENRATMMDLEKVEHIQLHCTGLSMSFHTQVPIKVRVIPFNFPVHLTNFRTGAGWDGEVRELNLDSYEKLIRANRGEFHTGGDTSEIRRTTLKGHLQMAFTDYCPHQPLFHPYRYLSMLANFSYLSGHVVHFNCRSGKDRTGMLDAEAKLLAINLLDGAIPSDKAVLSSEQSNLLFDLAMNGGSIEIQRLNTGLPGSKLRLLSDNPLTDPLATRIGAHRWEQFQGYAGLAEI